MSATGIEAVVFDCLGTLLRLEPPGPLLRSSLARRGIDVTEDAARRAVVAEIRYYLVHHLDGRDERTLVELRDRCAGVVADSLGLGRREAAAVRGALPEALRFEPYPDAVPALEALRHAGLRLVVASNWDCSLPATLAAAGLASCLDGVVTSAQVGAAKPDPRPLLAALELTGCSADTAACVGDSPDTDVAGARAAGIRPLLLVREETVRPEEELSPAGGAGAGAGVPTVRSLDEARFVILGWG